MKRILLASLTSSIAIAAAMPADATIFIGYSLNGGAITQLASDTATPGATRYTGVVGNYLFNLGVLGTPMLTQPSLMTQAMVTQIDNGQTGQNNVVSIYFSNTDLSAFSGGLMSSFTSNLLSGSAQSVMMSTYYNAANAAYSGTLMKMSTFTGLGVAQGGPAINVAGPFSTTVRYDVTFGSGAGTTNDTVNLVAVPEPASWALMIVGFGLMGGALRSRKTKVAFA